MARQNLTGREYGRLTVAAFHSLGAKSAAIWECICQCGKASLVRGDRLLSGETTSCGCLRDEMRVQRKKKHGLSSAPEYSSWEGMRNRCNNPSYVHYENYGGRGIRVCESWANFENFLADMGPRPSKSHSVDRIDVNGDYEPGNCRWATAKTQQRNRRDNVVVTYQGTTATLSEICEQHGHIYQTAARRLRHGASIDTAMRAGRLPRNTLEQEKGE